MVAPQETVAFLKRVLPENGFYIGHYRNGKDIRQEVYHTIEALAAGILAYDAEGWTTYHACAAFKEQRGVWNATRKKWELRSHGNVKSVRSLFVDLDCGPGKPYASAREAYDATCHFCAAVGLPYPVMVGSGSGLHCYWPLPEESTFEEWTHLARSFKQICLTHGFKGDPVRTADASSVLRTPGTHNRKHGEEVLVTVSNTDATALSREVIAHIAATRVSGPRSSATKSPENGPVLCGPGNGSAFGDLGTNDPADFARIVEGCAQVADFANRRAIGEPRYHGCLGVVAWCKNGRAIAHELSKHDPKYTEEAVDERLDRLKTLSGATTCAKFHSLDPSICERCPHFGKINSPAKLGYGTISGGSTEAARPVGRDDGGGRLQLPRLPDGFIWGNTGQLMFSTEDGQGQRVNTVITEHPVYVDAVSTNEVDTLNTYSYRFQRHLPHKGWECVSIDAAEMHGSRGLSALHGKGVLVEDPKLFMLYVRRAVTDYHKVSQTQIRYEQFGWKNGDTAYLVGRHLYTAAGTLTAYGTERLEQRVPLLGPRKGAVVAVWTEAIEGLFARQMEAYSVVVIASFASVFMKFLSGTEGGCWIHQFTPDSGRGKTTALQGAWTVWGQKNGTSVSEIDTGVYKFTSMSVLCHMPAFYDEPKSKDPDAVRDTIMKYAEGKERGRGTPTGDTRSSPIGWSNICMSGSNTSILELLPPATGDDAAGFRLLELMCKLSAADLAIGDELKDILEANAGVAGDIFIRYLLAPGVMDWCRAALRQWARDLREATRLPPEHRFRIRVAAAIVVAATIVIKLGLVRFNLQRIIDFLIYELQRPFNQGVLSSVHAVDRASQALADFLAAHQAEVLEVAGPWKPKTPAMTPLRRPYGEISMRLEQSTKKLFISESVFREFCRKKNVSPRMIFSTLEKHGVILEHGVPRTLTAGTTLPGSQMKTIILDLQHPMMGGFLAAVASPAVQQAEALSSELPPPASAIPGDDHGSPA